MPWQEVTPMEQKLLFVADAIKNLESFTTLCQRYGISRKTGYKWLARYESQGMAGLAEQSRRPKGHPHQTPPTIRQAIIELRNKVRSTPGAKKIRGLLVARYPNEDIPSETTIYNILKHEGLIKERRKRRRVSPYPQPFAPVRSPNELWSTDYKGQFKLGNGRWCYPLTVMDHASRFLIGCQGLEGPRFKPTQAAFIRLFREYGLPGRIRSDNGVPFATTAAGGLSRLAIWWIRLGVWPERIEPGKPQQNGRHERMHRTLKQEATKPASNSLRTQQRRFDSFRQTYNDERLHEALGQQTPRSHYSESLRPYPEVLPEMIYPDYLEIRQVQGSGVINWRGRMVYVGHLLHREQVALEEVDDGVWDVYFGPVRLGGFDERNVKGNQVPYLTIKV